MSGVHNLKFIAAAAVVAAGRVALAGPDWVESGDAGSSVSSAQIPIGTSGAPINSISGVLTGNGLLPDFEDCYMIKIINPAAFSMRAVGANFNARLYLFNVTIAGAGYGLLDNDDQTGTNNLPLVNPLSTDGTNVHVTVPGDYMIAITGSSRHADSLTGHIYFHEIPTEISGPDGPGGFNALTGWSGAGEFGSYNIVLTGAGFPGIPAPGSMALLALGGVLAARRKR